MFTIFREDLSGKDRLLEKIGRAYSAEQEIGHADFNAELMLKLRRDWETDPQLVPETGTPAPTAPEETFPEKRALRPYSVLCAFSANFSERNAETLAEAYFCGTKIILFVENAADYDSVLFVFESAFRTPNLQADRSCIFIGRNNGMETEEYLSEMRRGFRGCRSRENKWKLKQT